MAGFYRFLVAYAALTAADTLKKETPALENVEEVIETQVPVRPLPKAWALL